MKIKYLFKRGNSLWSRAPVEGKPKGYRYPMGMFNDVSPRNKKEYAREWERLYELAYTRKYEPIEKTEVSSPTPTEIYRPSFSDMVNRYLEEYIIIMRAGSYKCICGQVKPLIKRFGDLPYDSIEKKVVLKWLSDLRANGDGQSVNTLNTLIAYLRKIYSYNLENDEKLVQNRNVGQMISLKPWPEEPRRRHCAPSMEKQRTIYYEWYRKHYPEYAKIYLFRVLTGFRPKMTHKLTWAQHSEDTVQGKVLHKFTVDSYRNKNKKTWEYYIPDDAWDLIKLDFRSGLVFTNPRALTKDKAWNTNADFHYTKKLKRAFPDDPDCKILTKEERRTKDTLVARSTRTAYATNCLEVEHQDVNVVRENMGHVHISSTERYRQSSKMNRLKVIYPEFARIQDENSTFQHIKAG